jgi:hypothetical protein
MIVAMRVGWGGVLVAFLAACSGADETTETGETAATTATTSTTTTGSTSGSTTADESTGFVGCGDGVVMGDEECDDGEANADDAVCTAECTINVCGDGKVGPGESCDAPDDPACTEDCRAVLFADDAEIGGGSWEHGLVDDAGCEFEHCSLDQWLRVPDEIPDNPDPNSTRSWTSGDLSLVRGPMSSRLWSAEIDLSAASAPIILDFDHSYSFKDIGAPKPYGDGAVVEVAVDGGDFEIVAHDGYITPIGDPGGCAKLDRPANPLLGEMAFAGQVSGWFHETVELSAYAGSTIRVAFRVASDCGSYQQPYGEPVIYYVDNVRLSASTAP